jgi:hypothetical protein
MPIYTPGKLILSKIQQYPAIIGEAFGGGYFAGYISHTADGNPTHALIVAPRATGATGNFSGNAYPTALNLSYKTSNTNTPNANSSFDGVVNTAAMVTQDINAHPAGKFCVDLRVGGFADWYLPSYYELDIAYFNLKPTTTNNNLTAGTNIYAVPRRSSNWSISSPPQTSLTAFNTSAEAFIADNHWASNQAGGGTTGFYVSFSEGRPNNNAKLSQYFTRAFRRISLP